MATKKLWLAQASEIVSLSGQALVVGVAEPMAARGTLALVLALLNAELATTGQAARNSAYAYWELVKPDAAVAQFDHTLAGDSVGRSILPIKCLRPALLGWRGKGCAAKRLARRSPTVHGQRGASAGWPVDLAPTSGEDEVKLPISFS